MTTSTDTTRRSDLDPARVEQARGAIDPVFLDTPQYEDDLLNAALGRRVVVKVETLNPIRSFKGRGVGFALHGVERGTRIVCASSGNFGQAVAYVGRARGLDVRVFASDSVNPAKKARMEAFGAEVVLSGDSYGAAREGSRRAAADEPRTLLLEDGTIPAIAEGAGTIALELGAVGPLDAVVVPIGDGSLIGGVACWLRHHAPSTRIIGVNPSTAPTMHDSLAAGAPVTVRPENDFAEGISVPVPYPESLERVDALVDEVVLVDDAALSQAMGLIAGHLGVLPEPAGAAGIAAIAQGLVAGDRVATLVTGANPSAAGVQVLLDALG